MRMMPAELRRSITESKQPVGIGSKWRECTRTGGGGQLWKHNWDENVVEESSRFGWGHRRAESRYWRAFGFAPVAWSRKHLDPSCL